MQSTQFSKSLLSYVGQICDGQLPVLPEQDLDIWGDSQFAAPDLAEARGRTKSQSSFLSFLGNSELSDACGPLPREDLDMTWPMSSYYISTSHNTYLSGNQLYGAATSAAYRRVLQHNCRCIEIDVWDGKLAEEDATKGDETGLLAEFERHFHRNTDVDLAKENTKIRSAEPRVLHGHTLTTQIPFRVVCEAIKECAFTNSDLPLIVSLEVHCGEEQQAKMVQIMREVWGNDLVAEPGSECQILPSPGELRRKILIKVKGGSVTSPPSAEHQEHHESSDSDEHHDERGKDTRSRPDTAKKMAISKALGELGIYTKAYHFKGFEMPEATIPVHVFSLSEKKVLHEHDKDQQRLFTHNRSFLMRVFPSGLRVRSTNINPIAFWRKGVQMAAINWQKLDAGAMMNTAMFAGSDGWILKPEGYRHPSRFSQAPQAMRSNPEVVAMNTITLELRFLCAVGLVGARRPFIRCQLHIDAKDTTDGAEDTCAQYHNEYKRDTRHGHGDSPDFLCDTISFRKVDNVLLKTSFIRFKIMENTITGDNLLSWACIRLDRLRPGYRLVHLMDLDGNALRAMIFLHVSVDLH